MSENQLSASARARERAEKIVASPRRADEHRPAGAVGERRAHHLRPQARVHVGVFVEHDAVEIDAAQRVRIVGAVEPHLPAVAVIDAQLAVMDRCARARAQRRLAQIVPGDRLRLLEERRHIGKARPLLRAGERGGVQLGNAGDGLARAPVAHNAGKALRARVEGDELRARHIGGLLGRLDGTYAVVEELAHAPGPGAVGRAERHHFGCGSDAGGRTGFCICCKARTRFSISR
jgi:hypothetical protein